MITESGPHSILWFPSFEKEATFAKNLSTKLANLK